MNSRNLFASILIACLLAVGFLHVAPAANAEPGGKSFLKRGESAKNNVIKRKRRARAPVIHLPMGPAYVYYDYPYYYARGHYPTHIVRYVYYPYYYSRFYPRCSNGKCVADWRYIRDSKRRNRARRK